MYGKADFLSRLWSILKSFFFWTKIKMLWHQTSRPLLLVCSLHFKTIWKIRYFWQTPCFSIKCLGQKILIIIHFLLRILILYFRKGCIVCIFATLFALRCCQSNCSSLQNLYHCFKGLPKTCTITSKFSFTKSVLGPQKFCTKSVPWPQSLKVLLHKIRSNTLQLRGDVWARGSD